MKKSLEEDGYFILKTDLRDRLNRVKEEFISVFSEIAVGHGLPKISSVQQVIELYRGPNKPLWVAAWGMLANLPSVYALSSAPEISNCLEIAGVKFPALGFGPQIRSDMPSDPTHGVFDTHQDFSYNIGSTNSVTVWIPFQDVTQKEGCLRVVPKSHKLGLLPNEKGIIQGFPDSQLVNVPMKLGEILVFNQFLIHKSGKNISEDIRFSLQLRVNDLSRKEYILRKYPYNHGHVQKANASAEQAAEILKLAK